MTIWQNQIETTQGWYVRGNGAAQESIEDAFECYANHHGNSSPIPPERQTPPKRNHRFVGNFHIPLGPCFGGVWWCLILGGWDSWIIMGSMFEFYCGVAGPPLRPGTQVAAGDPYSWWWSTRPTLDIFTRNTWIMVSWRFQRFKTVFFWGGR